MLGTTRTNQYTVTCGVRTVVPQPLVSCVRPSRLRLRKPERSKPYPHRNAPGQSLLNPGTQNAQNRWTDRDEDLETKLMTEFVFTGYIGLTSTSRDDWLQAERPEGPVFQSSNSSGTVLVPGQEDLPLPTIHVRSIDRGANALHHFGGVSWYIPAKDSISYEFRSQTRWRFDRVAFDSSWFEYRTPDVYCPPGPPPPYTRTTGC